MGSLKPKSSILLFKKIESKVFIQSQFINYYIDYIYTVAAHLWLYCMQVFDTLKCCLIGRVYYFMRIVHFLFIWKHPKRVFGLVVLLLVCFCLCFFLSFCYRIKSEKRTIFLHQRTIKLPTLGGILVSNYQSMLIIFGSGIHHMN